LLSILYQAVRGNGLISLAYQEIAAKLNIANGAGAVCIQQTLTSPDALIGNLVIPPVGIGLSAADRSQSYTGSIQSRQLVCTKLRAVSAADAGCQSTAATDAGAKA